MSQWTDICQLEDIQPGTGVCALVGNQQIAIFRPYNDEQIFALNNIDPFTQASVLSNGLIVEHENELWVAAPLKKQRFRLSDGYCLEDEKFSIATFTCRVINGIVQISH